MRGGSMDSVSQLIIVLSKLIAEAEKTTALRIQKILLLPPFNRTQEELLNMSLSDTLTLLEQLAAKIQAEEVQEDAEAKEQVEKLQNQIRDLESRVVSDTDKARLDALKDQLEAMLPKVEEPPTPPVVPPAVPGNPTEEVPGLPEPPIVQE